MTIHYSNHTGAERPIFLPSVLRVGFVVATTTTRRGLTESLPRAQAKTKTGYDTAGKGVQKQGLGASSGKSHARTQRKPRCLYCSGMLGKGGNAEWATHTHTHA